MTYPTFYPYRTHVVQIDAGSSNTNISVPVPFRGVLLSVTQSNNVTPTVAGVFDICQNGSTAGSTVAGLGGLTATTGAIGSGGSVTYVPSDLVYINPGDVLVTVPSSQVAASYTFAIREA